MPFPLDESVTTGTFFGGVALVFADDPRIQVAAFLPCKEDFGNGASIGQDLRTMTHLPAYPVGASMAYFQAGVPGASGTPGATPSGLSGSTPR